MFKVVFLSHNRHIFFPPSDCTVTKFKGKCYQKKRQCSNTSLEIYLLCNATDPFTFTAEFTGVLRRYTPKPIWSLSEGKNNFYPEQVVLLSAFIKTEAVLVLYHIPLKNTAIWKVVIVANNFAWSSFIDYLATSWFCDVNTLWSVGDKPLG